LLSRFFRTFFLLSRARFVKAFRRDGTYLIAFPYSPLQGNRTMNIRIMSLAALALTPCLLKADDWHKHWTVDARPEVHILTGDASVLVEAAGDGAVDARLTTRGWAIGGSSGIQVIEHQAGNRIEIEVKVPSMHFGMGNHSVRLEVRVPRELIGEIRTGDGSIELRGLHGPVHATTGDGSIRADDLDGALTAYTGDGSVHVRGRFDNLQIHTSDGSVQLDVLTGSRLNSNWRVQTGDGSVRLNVPRDLAADFEMHTGDGHIETSLPLSVIGRQNSHQMQGKLNGGGPTVLVRTGDGSINLGTI
jgi:hypothetical protein